MTFPDIVVHRLVLRGFFLPKMQHLCIYWKWSKIDTQCHGESVKTLQSLMPEFLFCSFLVKKRYRVYQLPGTRPIVRYQAPVISTRHQVSGSRDHVPSTRYQGPSMYQVTDSRSQAQGTGPGSRCQVPKPCEQVPGTGYQVYQA